MSLARPGAQRTSPQDGPRPLGFFDRFFLEAADPAEHHPELHIGGLLILGGPPPETALLQRYLADQIKQIPALGYRLAARADRWEPDPAFDPLAHLTERRLAPGDDVIDAGRQEVTRPFDRERPLWGITCLHGYATDEYALCYRAHHAFQDGMAILSVAQSLFRPGSPQRSHETAGTGTATPRRWPALTDLGVPLTPTSEWTPNRAPLTGDRALHIARLDRVPLQEIAEATGTTVNQVALAVLSGAFRAWSPQDWKAAGGGRAPGRGLHVAVPVDLRPRAGGLEPGNLLGVIRVALPCHQPSPIERLRQVQRQTGAERIARHRAMDRVLLRRLPYRLARAAMLRITAPRFTALAVSTLRATAELDLDGASARAVYAFPPLLPGHHGMVIIMEGSTEVVFSLLFDTAAPRAELLPGLLENAAAELHAAAVP
ncbi:wax ester/triacylglycerol synthase domain-containing protein [Actinomadura gamaensis]|uniref:diacylglycerol O-acyltransferase n=1 Tax=Actinomadura gamaensis TaxID=1763541 RepID=A0ABV9UBH2_9ACTN